MSKLRFKAIGAYESKGEFGAHCPRGFATVFNGQPHIRELSAGAVETAT
jgi:hypothetical protein